MIKRIVMVVCFFSSYFLFAQLSDLKNIQTPDTYNFIKSQYYDVENSGGINLKIKLFEFAFEGIQIPLELSYNSKGVIVNSSASRVGTNWTFNPSGFIAREIIDKDDFSFDENLNNECSVIFNKGRLVHANFDVDPVTNDEYPDIYRVYAPGLNTEFIYNMSPSPPINLYANELKKTSNKIETFYNKPPSGCCAYIYSVSVTNGAGFQYTFSNIESSNGIAGTDYSNLYNGYPNNELTSTRFYNFTEYLFYAYAAFAKYNNYVTNYLTKIKSLYSNNSIEYIYEEETLMDNNRHVDFNYPINGSHFSQTNFHHDLQITKRLKKIIFPEGEIIFYYFNNREDLIGSKSLDKIDIRNTNGKLIKSYNFVYSYFNSCNEPECKRLMLDEIYISNENNETLPFYKFEYYKDYPIPKKFSLRQDYFGISNINPNSNILPQSYSKPKLYTKHNEITLPFNPNTNSNLGYVANDGNFDREPNLPYAICGSLKKMTTPTGGDHIFEYELNTCTYKGNQITLPGLRIKKQIIKNNETDYLMKEYKYSIDDNKSSGLIIPISSLSYSEDRGLFYNQFNSNVLEQFGSSFIIYKKIEEKQILNNANNGKVINQYNVSYDESDNTHFTDYQIEYINYGHDITSELNGSLKNGGLRTHYNNYLKGLDKLEKSEIYDSNNNLIQSTYFDYIKRKKDSLDVSINFPLSYIDYPCDFQYRPYAKLKNKMLFYDFNLTSKKVFEYNTTGVITSIENYIYSDNNNIKENIKTINYTKQLKKVYYYADDLECLNEPYINLLQTKNIFDLPIITKEFENNNLLFEYKNIYNLYNNKLYNSKIINTKKDGISWFNSEITKVNDCLKPIEIKYNDYLFKSIIYDGNNNIAAIINNTKLDEISIDVLNQYKNQFQFESVQNINALLKSNFSDKHIETYYFEPLIGMKYKEEINGLKRIYEYDNFNRLNCIKENENIINKYEYNFKTNTTHTPITQVLSGNIIKEYLNDHLNPPVLDNYKLKLYANIEGGVGSYSYEWRIEGINNVLSTSNYFISNLPCGQNKYISLKVTDLMGNVINLVTNHTTHLCNQSLNAEYIPVQNFNYSITSSSISVQGVGGSWEYEYSFFNQPFRQSNEVYINVNSCPENYGIPVKVKDKNTNDIFTFSIYVNVLCEGSEWEEHNQNCFVAGTKILLSDNTYKNIENVKIGDEIITYNIDEKKLENGVVEEIDQPFHDNLIRIEFENGIINENTHDHPYYVKGKGWCSINPELTYSNYSLHVSKIDIGDLVYFYNEKKEIVYVKIKNIIPFVKNQKTYNLKKVSKNHNFFANGILVHNKSNN